MKLVRELVNLKNALVNSVFVRLIWLIVGAVAAISGFTFIGIKFDLMNIDREGKARLFNDDIYGVAGAIKKPEPEKEAEKPKVRRVYKKTNSRAKKADPPKEE